MNTTFPPRCDGFSCRQLFRICLLVAMALFPLSSLRAQNSTEYQQVLQRLEHIEEENRQLAAEIRALREELHKANAIPAEPPAAVEKVPTSPEPAVPVGEVVGMNTTRIDEMAQTKVESTQRFPLRITGMALFNAFLNGQGAGGVENPATASLIPGSASGATMRQSILGLQYQGPQTVFGGTVNGSLYMDLFGGTTSSLNHLLRLRVATIELRWDRRSFFVGQDKPIISPREPNSLSQVGVSPLTGAGNLWLWQPQARYEERFRFGQNSGLTAQIGVFQTSESATTVPAEYSASVDRSRPALQGRFELWRKWGETRRIEIAPGFHKSASHVAGFSVPSDLATVDWLIKPASRFEWTGMFYSGENIAGLGALRQGFTVRSNESFIPVHSTGGWTQLRILPTERLSFNLYGGQQNNQNSDLRSYAEATACIQTTGAECRINKNQGYFANMMYRIAPNVVVSLESGQLRTRYFNAGTRLNNHYDLAIAYLF